MVMMLALLEEWQAVGHALATGDWIVRATALGGAVVFVVWLLVAATRTRRYRAVGVLSDADRGRVRAAIAAAEAKSRGELAVVVVERSDSHPHADWLIALTAMALGSTALASTSFGEHATLVLAANVVFAVVGFGASKLFPDFKRTFVSARRAEEMAREQAIQEFAALAMHRTSGRTAVLIFVSLFERSVVVLGDEAIHSKVGDAGWLEVDAAVLERVRSESLAAGLIAGVERAGAILATHFPSDGDNPNELADHLIVRES